MNLIEKYIFDLTRKKNIHNLSQINSEIKDNEKAQKIKRYVNLYYRAYSHIDDNEIILDNYFSNSELLLFLGKNINKMCN